MDTLKDIEGLEGFYRISDSGKVFSLKSGSLKELALKINTSGYKSVTISHGKIKRSLVVHRHVAKAFIPNPNNLPQVNHINGIKTDNSVENLEWCTQLENIQHGKEHGLFRGLSGSDSPVAKKVLNTKTGEIYPTLIEAARKTGIKRHVLVYALLTSKNNTTGLKYLSDVK